LFTVRETLQNSRGGGSAEAASDSVEGTSGLVNLAPNAIHHAAPSAALARAESVPVLQAAPPAFAAFQHRSGRAVPLPAGGLCLINKR